jgi:hypothetical protein
MTEETDLIMWTIYNRPLDMPDCYVARKWIIRRNSEQPIPTSALRAAGTLEEVRNMLPRGLHRLDRFIEDDPKIVEVWL